MYDEIIAAFTRPSCTVGMMASTRKRLIAGSTYGVQYPSLAAGVPELQRFTTNRLLRELRADPGCRVPSLASAKLPRTQPARMKKLPAIAPRTRPARAPQGQGPARRTGSGPRPPSGARAPSKTTAAAAPARATAVAAPTRASSAEARERALLELVKMRRARYGAPKAAATGKGKGPGKRKRRKKKARMVTKGGFLVRPPRSKKGMGKGRVSKGGFLVAPPKGWVMPKGGFFIGPPKGKGVSKGKGFLVGPPKGWALPPPKGKGKGMPKGKGFLVGPPPKGKAPPRRVPPGMEGVSAAALARVFPHLRKR